MHNCEDGIEGVFAGGGKLASFLYAEWDLSNGPGFLTLVLLMDEDKLVLKPELCGGCLECLDAALPF